MKKYLSKIIPIFIILWIFLYMPGGVVTGLRADQSNATGAKNETANVGYLENILFEKLAGRERVSLVVSQQPLIAPPSIQLDNSLLIRLENLFAPDNMQEILGVGQLLNVTGVQAQQQAAAGKQWVNLKINLKENVPYSIRQEGKIVVIDFNISSGEAKLNAMKQQDPIKSKEVSAGDGAYKGNEAKIPARRETTKRDTDRMISLDFQDADIKSVFRLMAEYGKASIISGDDVKGNVTLSMKNVPWDQALDAILKIHGLAKQQTGDILTVMTLERQRKDEQNRKTAEEEMRKAEDDRKARELQTLVEKGKLRQILIEAKIVEATEEFVRNLGVQWGFGNSQSVGSYGLGLSGATNPLTQTNARRQTYPPEISWTTGGKEPLPLTMAAVNLPSAILGPTFGLVFGNARGFIETQLSALESTAQGKVISAPKVVTMDDVKAVIKQGEEVPYVTPASGTSPATVTFKEALLLLEVKPKITSEGRISMVITAKNDTPDYAKGVKYGIPTPLRKNELSSTVVVSDGDTVVIGGVSRNDESKVESGVPWFYKIPVLGWLFKTENITKNKQQLLIFITPKILSGSGYIEDECNTANLDNLDRCRNRK